jgi:hypothetical protein
MIDGGEARIIASEWHGGQTSALYAFSSSGAFVDGLQYEIEREIDAFTREDTWGELSGEARRDEDHDRLCGLLDYIEAHVPRYIVTCGDQVGECTEMYEALDLAATFIEENASQARAAVTIPENLGASEVEAIRAEAEQDETGELGYAECVRSDDCGDFSAAIRAGDGFHYADAEGNIVTVTMHKPV